MADFKSVLIGQLSACPTGGGFVRTSNGTIHIDMPDGDDGSLTKMPVVLHLPEDMALDGIDGAENTLDSMDDVIKIEVPGLVSGDGLSPADHESSLLDETFGHLVSMNGINLEDFVDVVTTYKCKFCRFTSPWKSGLISHIRSAHLMPQKPVPACTTEPLVSVNDEEPQLSDVTEHSHETIPMPDSAVMNESIPMDPAAMEETTAAIPTGAGVQETHLFLCGQCHQGFDTFDHCKDHIVTVHQSVPEMDEPPPPPKKRKPRKKLKRYEIFVEPLPEQETVWGKGIKEEILGKRKVRPPRALREDYYMISTKRKYVKQKPDPEIGFRCGISGCNLRFRSADKRDYHERCHPESLPGDQVSVTLFCCPECESDHRPLLDGWQLMAQHLWKGHQLDLDLLAGDVRPNVKKTKHRKNGRRAKDKDESTPVSATNDPAVPSGTRHRQLPCEHCGRHFADSRSLRKHVAVVHRQQRPFVCSVCSHACARRSTLVLHARQHTGEKPYKCDHPGCDYQTCDHNSLRRHRMRHSGEKPYKCPHCPYACIQAISYKVHLHSKHPGQDGIYDCQMCTFRSVSKEIYVQHVNDHRRGTISLTGASTAVVPDTASTLIATEDPGVSELSATQLIYSCLSALTQQQQQAASEQTTEATAGETDERQVFTIQFQDGTADGNLRTTRLLQSSDADGHVYLTIEQQPVSLPDGVTDQDGQHHSALVQEAESSENHQLADDDDVRGYHLVEMEVDNCV